ncbi:MAG: motility protein A [Alphaproteobacteria bacterium]
MVARQTRKAVEGRAGTTPRLSALVHEAERQRLDVSTPLALGLALATVMTAIALGGPPDAFLDIRSLLIVLGGTLCVTAAGLSGSDIARALKSMRFVILSPAASVPAVSTSAVRMAEQVRKEGLPLLENALPRFKDRPFLHKAMAMAVDGLTPDDMERVLGDELRAIDERHRRTAVVFRRAADVAPAMGLIGTMVGLIQMLRMLEDPSAIGPAMALALLTTLYGAVLGHMVFGPLADRLDQRSLLIGQINTIHALTALAIARRESPRHLELAINAHLAPRDQARRFTS